MAHNRQTGVAARRQRVRVVRATTLPTKRNPPAETAPSTPDVPPSTPDQAPSTPDAGGRRPGRRRLVALLLAVAVLFGAFAVYAGVRWQRLVSASSSNAALTDNAATSEVTGQVSSAVNLLFSYDYTDLARTERAASELLTGAATCQYDRLFGNIRQQAPRQKLVVTVTVTSTGVNLLSGDRARLLVFATQSSTSAVSKQTSTAGAMFAIDAHRQGDRWKITGIDTFTGPVAGC
jgi:Mce-associated membrane protein